MIASFAALAVFIASASADTVFSSFAVKGVNQGLGVGVRVPSSNLPITDLTSDNLICNTGFVQPVSDVVVEVAAGSQVAAVFHRTSAGYTGPDPSDPLDPTDKGPLTAYLASVPSATQSDVTGLEWFKIFEYGLNTTSHQWGSDIVFINNGTAAFTIPPCINSGQYLLRAEVLGLENAYAYPGAEFFMSCAQISVTGGTGTAAPETVSFPGAYSSSDPGIVTDIYGITSYTVPGPAVLQC